MILYFMILISLEVIYILVKLGNSALEKKAKLNKKEYGFEDLINYYKEMFKYYNLDTLKLKYLKYYSFNTVERSISIVKKKEYSYLDIFKFFHEIGHYIFEQSNKKIYMIHRILMTLFTISRIGLNPFLIIYGIYVIVKNNNIMPFSIYVGIELLYFSINIIRIITIPLIENKANNIAKEFLIYKRTIQKNTEEERIIKRACSLAIVDQIIISCIYLFINSVLFYFGLKYLN